MFGGWGFGGSNEDHGNAKELQNDPEFNKEMSSAGSKLVVVDFFAVWCGPCKMVAPQFAALSKKYTNVVFLKVDVDKLSGTAGTAGVRAMPTFQFYKNNSKIDEVVGGDMAAVEQKIQKHMTSASAFEGNAGRVLGRSSAQPGVNPYQQQASQQNQPIISEQDLYKALAGVGTTGQQNVQQNIQNTVQQTSQQQVPEQQATSSSDVAQVDNTPVEITDAQVQDEANKLEQSRPMIRLEANEDLLNELLAMEFPRTRAEKALILTSNQGVEQAIDWIMNHGEDMDIDEPITEQQRNVPAPETPEQREERYRQARQKALELQKHIRQKVADQEKKAELEREKKRRQMGKETGVMKEELAQMQRQKEIEEKKREKKREIEAKKAALDKIAAQKEARRLEALARKGIVPEEQQQQSQSVQQPVQQSAPQTEYTECQLQVRLFDGSTIRGTFKPTDTVKAVYDFVRTKQAGNFKLMTTFPRRIYDASTHNLTLKEADLMPRASLVLTQ